MQESKSKNSQEYSYFWFVYPFYVLLLSYLSALTMWANPNIGTPYKIGYSLGWSIVFFIIPLIIVGVRKIFTKNKLSPIQLILLFYLGSLGIFVMTFPK